MNAEKFNADLSKWDVAKGTDFNAMVRVARPRGFIVPPVATAHTDSPRPFRL